jgi:hypothetical protein
MTSPGQLKWVSDGQLVDAPIKGRWLRCTVICAMGDTARVVNELYGVDTWFPVKELRGCVPVAQLIPYHTNPPVVV